MNGVAIMNGPVFPEACQTSRESQLGSVYKHRLEAFKEAYQSQKIRETNILCQIMVTCLNTAIKQNGDAVGKTYIFKIIIVFRWLHLKNIFRSLIGIPGIVLSISSTLFFVSWSSVLEISSSSLRAVTTFLCSCTPPTPLGGQGCQFCQDCCLR